VVNCGYPMWHMIDDFFLQLVLVVWVMVSTGTASRRSRISSQNRVMAAEYVTICHVCHIKTRCHVKLQDVARCCKMLQEAKKMHCILPICGARPPWPPWPPWPEVSRCSCDFLLQGSTSLSDLSKSLGQNVRSGV